MKKTQLQIRTTDTLKNRIRKACDFLSISMSEFVISAINEKLDRMGR